MGQYSLVGDVIDDRHVVAFKVKVPRQQRAHDDLKMVINKMKKDEFFFYVGKRGSQKCGDRVCNI